MEVRRTKNVASIIVFPIQKNDGTLITGAAGLDSEIDHWADASAPDGFADCTNEATEIGSTGQYYLSLTQAESNYDYSVVQVKSSTTGALVQTILINRTLQQSDVAAISSDTTAADNAELMFDGTGYAGGSTKLGVDVVAVSGDTTAADNLEAFTDGTGYAGGTVKLGVDVVAISGDATAADNCELDYDGTGYAGGTIVKGADVTKIGGAALATGTAQVGVNVVNIAGSAVNTATAQIGANVVTQADIDFGATQKASIATAVYSYVVENSKSFLTMFRLLYAVLCNKSTGGGTSTVAFRDDGDSKDRVVATVDNDGNRTVVTKDGTV